MVVAHVILESAQVLLVLTLGLWTLDFGLGLDKNVEKHNNLFMFNLIVKVSSGLSWFTGVLSW